MNSEPPQLCPECGKPVPPDSQHRLCPACLMAQALASRTILPEGEKASTVPPPSPEEIADKFPQFEILECLGRGGMGVVYKARQKSLNRTVAIKILAPEREHDARFAERFAREAELLAKLSHPHIVTIHDFGETGGFYYIVMEFVDGVNLRDLLREGKIEPKQALAIVPPICEALQCAHEKGVVHRDIKPENLLLDREGRVKIADFGIASLVGAEGESAGTPPYMAPEQKDAKPGADHRADIYALGVVLYEMLTGERPDKALVAPSKKVQIDVRLDEIVLRAMEKEPEKRYQTAGEFRTMVETMAGTPASSSHEPGDEWAAAAATGAVTKKTRQMIQWPAIAMMVVGGLKVVEGIISLLVLAAVVFGLVPLIGALGIPDEPFFEAPVWMRSLLTGVRGQLLMGALSFAVLIWMLLWLAAAVVVFVGGWRMRLLQSRRWAIAGAILLCAAAALGLQNLHNAASFVWCLPGLAIGVWALVALLRPEAREAFENGAMGFGARKPERAQSRPVPDRRDSMALFKVAAPAVGLMVASGLNFLLLGTLLLLGLLLLPTSPGMRPFWLILLPFFAIFLGASSLTTFIGAWRMLQLRGRSLAIVGAILAILTPPGLLIGVIFGIWALVVLSRREVCQAFDPGAARANGKGLRIAATVLAGVVLLAVLVVAGVRFGSMYSGTTYQFQTAASKSDPVIPGRITQKSLSSVVGSERFLDLETGRVFTNESLLGRPTPGVFRAAGIDLSVKFEAGEPRVTFLGCSVKAMGGGGPGGLIDGPAMHPDFVEPGWGKSLRQIYVELPVPSEDATSTVEGKLPLGVLVRTHYGPVALEISRYTAVGSDLMQLDLRYVLLPPPGGSPSPP